MQKIVYVIGVFDLFHSGHVRLLKRAKELGDKLIVAINGDDMVAEYKRRPYLNEEERLEVVQSCRYVDEAFIIREFDNKDAIIEHGINIIVHGDDWKGDSYLQQIRVTPEFVEKHQIELKFLPYTSGISTSDLINRIKTT
ncbi:MAG TPA: adenylyltransferase/cytidyltransferase family protein [Bacteroidales bacterium]|nr:adenylyltransferase/cytidyltransferase family protein [Bacteroidales bacterium]